MAHPSEVIRAPAARCDSQPPSGSAAHVAEQLEPRERDRRLAGARRRRSTASRSTVAAPASTAGRGSPPARGRASAPDAAPARVAGPDRRAASDPDPEQQIEDVRGVADQVRAVAEQVVGPLGDPDPDLPGNRADRPAELERPVGGDQRARRLGRLDDHRRPRPSAAMIRLRAGKKPRRGAGARRVLGDHRAARAGSRSSELAVAGRVDDVRAAGEDRDRRAARRERPAVGGGVDPAAPSR